MKQANTTWVHDPRQRILDSLNNVRYDASRCFRKKEVKQKYKIEELETNSLINLYKSINDFQKSYQHRTNRVKNDEGDLIEEFQSILANWRNFEYFSQPFNLQGVSAVRQTEIHTPGPLVSEPSVSEFELAIEKTKSHKSPDIK